MKKYALLVLVLLLVMSMLTGCVAGKTGGDATKDGTNGTTGDVNKKDPPVTLTMMIQSHASWPYNPDWYV